MLVVLMAGGDATRAFPFNTATEKSLLPLGGKPIIRIIIERLLKQGVCDGAGEITICCLERHLRTFRHEFRDMPDITYSVKAAPAGTLRHFLYACAMLISDTDVLLHYSDSLTSLDYIDMINMWSSIPPNDRTGLIHVTSKVRHPYSEVDLRFPAGFHQHSEFTKVVGFSEKPYLPRPSWTGIGIFRLRAIRELPSVRGDAELDFGRDILPDMTECKGLYAWETDDDYKDLGTASSYLKAVSEFDKL